MNGNKIKHDDYGNIDWDRTQRVHRAQPVSAPALDIEFFKKPDAQSDQGGIGRADFDRSSDRCCRQRAKTCKDRHGDQGRRQLAARGPCDEEEASGHCKMTAWYRLIRSIRGDYHAFENHPPWKLSAPSQ
jgi:hypothetical protein